MIVDVELTRQTDDHYVARVLQFPEVVVEASSREAALEEIREALIARQRPDTEIVQIAIENGVNLPAPTWLRHSGEFPDDEHYQAMLAEIERHRREVDALDQNLPT